MISRLDYCNSLLYDIPKYQRDKLQRIQNTAAQMITGARSYDHIAPILRRLRWLPVEARINSKILLITYKILNGQSAGYVELWLRNFVHQEHYNRLPVRYYAGRAFSTAAPQLSNTIQEYAKNADNVATFKTELKTFLFRKHCHWFLCLTYIFFFVLYKFLFRVSVVLIRVAFETRFTVVISYPLIMML